MQQNFDVTIIGGGLAGLSLSILLAKANKKVLLIEKKTFPLHKVCGEYVSLESWDFLKRLGLPLDDWELPIINTLNITMPPDTVVAATLPLGAMGISRYKLDFELYQLAANNNNITVLQNCSFQNMEGAYGNFKVSTNQGTFLSTLVIAATGKWHNNNLGAIVKGEKYVGVKYHLKLEMPTNLIALHHFKGGYAGISAIENNNFCLCYMVKASVLKSYGHIKNLEKNHLSKNKFLKHIFANAHFLWQEPLTISNIYFGKKQLVENDIFYIGDAAGAIPPLAGNGMSMAFRTAHLLAPILVDTLDMKITIATAQNLYSQLWQSNFNNRINAGIKLQSLLAHSIFGPIALKIFSFLKPIQKSLIKRTHGDSF
jgi:menaquinone-9 beta-reductase